MSTQRRPERGIAEHSDRSGHWNKLVFAVLLSALTAACASTNADTDGSAPAGTSTSVSTPAAPPSSSSPSSDTPGMPAMPGMTQTDAGPSASALMVCGPEIQKAVATALALDTPPTTTTTWTDHLYTCTYHLPTGQLVLSVKESPDSAAANAYFAGLRQQLGDAHPLTGAQGLGNPGYESAGGTVVILKDGKTLKADATGMPATSGPAKTSRMDLAYEITTDILGCWSEK